MVAWNNFSRCFSNFFPHRIQELVHYQAIICDFANQFTFSAWSNYDRMFRYQAAYNAALSWNRVDDDLYNRYLRGATIQQLCYVCRNFGHYASACPVRLGGLAQSSSLQDVAMASPSVPPFRPPPPPPPAGSHISREWSLQTPPSALVISLIPTDIALTTNAVLHTGAASALAPTQAVCVRNGMFPEQCVNCL